MRAQLTAVLVGHLLMVPANGGAQSIVCAPPGAGTGRATVAGLAVDGRTGESLGLVSVLLRSKDGEVLAQTRAAADGRFHFCEVEAPEAILWGEQGQRVGMAGPLTLEAGQTTSATLAVWSLPEDGGTLAGEIVQVEGGGALEGAYVLLPWAGRTAVSNENGRFYIAALPPGVYRTEIRRLGYADAVADVEISLGSVTQTRVTLAVEEIPIEPLVVTAVRRKTDLPDLEDFARRFYSGWGQFVLPEDIRRRNPSKVTDLLREAGAEVGANGAWLTIRRTSCAPTVYLDGVKITRLPRGGGSSGRKLPPQSGLYLWPDPEASPAQEAADAVNLLTPSQVLAIEVYRGPAETPGQYIDSDSRCGVILIWSRRGRDLPR